MRSLRTLPAAALALLLASACGSPDSNTNEMCGPNGSCPSGYTCDPKTNRCLFTGAVRDAGLDARPPVDALLLDTTLVDRPGSLSGPTAVFSFTASADGATFECSLDSAAFAACTSPTTVGPLADGPHSFAVRAVLGGQRDATPATASWTASSTAPVTTITMKPPAATNQTSAQIAFTASPAGSTTECSLDGAAFASCVSPQQLTSLAAGDHRFTVRATAPSGIKEASPPEVRWTIDLVGPAVSITSPAGGATTGKQVQVSFTAREQVARFECAKDDLAFAPCGSGSGGSVELVFTSGGVHTASVQGVDAAGNTGDPATVSFTVDATPPAVTIGDRDTGCLSEAMSFSADEAASFTCSLDGGAAAPCLSPFFLAAGTAGGSHRFTVVATDTHGNVAAPVTATIDIDKTGPTVTVTGTDPPADSRGFSDGSGAILFHSDGTAQAYRCALDGGSAADCSPQPFADQASYRYLRLTEAGNPHTLVVVGSDGCGNDGPPKSFSFRVDRTGPSYTLGAVLAPPDSGTVNVSYLESEPTAQRSCLLDGIPCEVCEAEGATCSAASAGEHLFVVSGTDVHGNAGGPTTSPAIVMAYGPNAGHAILIGHDFAASNAETEALLRNAVDQVPYRARGLFGRGLRVAVFRQATVDDAEADAVLAAISDRVDDSALAEFSSAGGLAAALRGKDLLLVPDQQDPAGADAVGKAWGSTLTGFLDRGGVAVVTDGLLGDGETPSRTFAVLGGGALAVSGSASFGPVGSPDLPARRLDDANDTLFGDLSPLSVGTSYLTTPTTAVFAIDQDTGAPRWVYGRVTTICNLGCFTTIVPIVVDKIFPVYSLSAGIAATAGPNAAIPFSVTPATPYERVDCAATVLSCDRFGDAPPCECAGGAQTCACEGSSATGFRLPFVTAGKYRVDLRLVDPQGSPGRAATAQVQVDLPAVSISPDVSPPYSGVFCFAGSTVDGRGLSYRLTWNGQTVTRDAVTSAACPSAVGSYTYQAACFQTNGFRVDATDRYGNTDYKYVSWYQGCVGKL